MRILLIEDEPVLGEAVATHLKRSGHAVDWVQRLDDAEAALRGVEYGLVLLDLHLPDGRGLDLLRALASPGTSGRSSSSRRATRSATASRASTPAPTTISSSPSTSASSTARILAVQRRSVAHADPTFRAGSLVIDQAARKVLSDGQEVELTAREWGLLECLAQRAGATLSKAQLEEALYAFGAEIESNAVEVYISRLRKKLGANAIRTVRGLGYRLEP